VQTQRFGIVSTQVTTRGRGSAARTRLNLG